MFIADLLMQIRQDRNGFKTIGMNLIVNIALRDLFSVFNSSSSNN